MKWFPHYATERESEALREILSDPDFGLKGYAFYFLIQEIITEKAETYTGRNYIAMTITQWCNELHTKWKILKLFLERYSSKLGLEWEIKNADEEKHSQNISKSLSDHSRSILIIKSPKLLETLGNHLHKNNKDFLRTIKNNKSVKRGFAEVSVDEKLDHENIELKTIFELFKDVNPMCNHLYENKTQRNALQRLCDTLGSSELKEIIKYLPQLVGEKYAPVITTPMQLENKLGELKVFKTRMENELEPENENCSYCNNSGWRSDPSYSGNCNYCKHGRARGYK